MTLRLRCDAHKAVHFQNGYLLQSTMNAKEVTNHLRLSCRNLVFTAYDASPLRCRYLRSVHFGRLKG